MEKIKFKKRFLIYFTFVISATFFFGLYYFAQAAGEFRLTTSSLPINLETVPNSSVKTQLRIKNDGTQNENIKVSLMKFKVDSETGVPVLLEGEEGDDFLNWVSFSENSFELAVNEWKTIGVKIDVPQTAAFGYYYAVVFSRLEKENQAATRQTLLTGGTATMILLNVNVPGAKKEVTLEKFGSFHKWYEFLPAIFTVRLRNTGNVYVAPRGNIFITRGGKNLATLEINPNKGSIIANSPREFQGEWTNGFPFFESQKNAEGQLIKDEQGRVKTNLKWNWSEVDKFRWGKYTAKLVLIYDDGQRDVPLEAETTFWVVPWRIGGGFFVLGSLILIGLKVVFLNVFKKIKKLFLKK